MKMIKILFIAMLVIMIAGPAVAQHRQGHKKMDRQKRAEVVSKYLDLSDQQKEQIKEIRLQSAEAMVPVRNELREKHARLKSLTSGDDTDFDAAEVLVDEIADLRADMMKQGLQTRQQIRSLLTDEQKVKFDARQGRMHQSGARRMRNLKR